MVSITLPLIATPHTFTPAELEAVTMTVLLIGRAAQELAVYTLVCCRTKKLLSHPQT